MQSFDTETGNTAPSPSSGKTFVVTGIDDLRPGGCVTFDLLEGDELAVYNVNGEYYAIENSCPHRGAPLSEGVICEYVVECGLHGWQFDVRTGECLTVKDTIRTYPVRIEDGVVKVDIL